VTVGQIAQAGGEMLRSCATIASSGAARRRRSRLAELKRRPARHDLDGGRQRVHGTIRVVRRRFGGQSHRLVYVDLPPNERLRPGMFARGEIAIWHASPHSRCRCRAS
jgi:hypothetical protein